MKSGVTEREHMSASIIMNIKVTEELDINLIIGQNICNCKLDNSRLSELECIEFKLKWTWKKDK